MQQDRRQNPYPYTGEIALAAALGSLVLVIAGVHAGALLANLLTGHGIHWPAHQDWITTLPGIMRGDSGAGVDLRDPAPQLLLWACIAAAEITAAAIVITAATAYQRRYGAARIRGMASRAEAAKLLGPARLRRHAAIVRPDLHGPGRSPR